MRVGGCSRANRERVGAAEPGYHSLMKDPSLWESLAERLVREAAERGEFDALAGSGRPIPGLNRPCEPDWWAKQWLRRARLEDAADELRRRIRNEVPRLRAMQDREAAGVLIAELNAAIEAVNEELPEGQRLDLEKGAG